MRTQEFKFSKFTQEKWSTNKLTLSNSVLFIFIIARSTEDFNGAMLKAVCVEAGMNALRRGATFLHH